MNKITRKYLESFIGKKVKLTDFENEVFEGELQAGNGFFYVPKWYCVANYTFRLSHIKKIEEVERWK